MSDSVNIVFLAAGKGTRLKVDIAKPLIELLGAPLVDYVIDGIEEFEEKENLQTKYGFVVGYKKDEVESFVRQRLPQDKIEFAHQVEQLGTGHALKTYFDSNPSGYEQEYTLVVCADTPLIREDVYEKLYSDLKKSKADAVCASFHTDNPSGYGRIVKNSGLGFKIVEEKDATEVERKITEVNSGLYIFKTSHIKEHINNLNDNNKSGEFYLTDLFKEDQNVKTYCFDSESDFLGVNNLVQLEQAERIIKNRINESHMLAGVRIKNSETVLIEKTAKIDAGVVIHPNVSIFGNSSLETGTILENGVIVKDSKIGSYNLIKANSYLEGCIVGDNTALGPMARLREGSVIGDKCKLGNFVETKKVYLEKGVKVSHLSYVGDAEVGENTNIGCGFITCNYDGANKHKTIIGKNSFIGSDCQMIAPISIGNESYIGSGSTINQDVPDGAFAIARQRQVTKEDMAKKFIKKKS